jgi:D-alanyl-D-alanine carboxypeptidase
MTTLPKFFSLSFLCVLLSAPATGMAAQKATVPSVIRSFFKTNGLVGLSVSIRNHERTVTYKHGYANLEYPAAISDKTVFRIASVSKLFTTLGILKLKEQGKLSVDDTISKYITNFPYGDSITIKNLLQHTTGIPNYAALDSYGDNEAKEWTAAELVELLRQYLNSHALDFEPGTTADYSNSNYVLLGAIIEAISGMAFKDFIAQEVVTPLGMKDTGVGSDSQIIRYRAAGYQVTNGMPYNTPYVSVVAPFATGDFMSRPMELAKITDVFKPGRFLTQATIDEMCAPVVLKNGASWIERSGTVDVTFGYCWELVRPVGKTEWIYTKSGSISGFFAYLFYFPSAGVTVTIDANAQGNFSLAVLGLGIGDAMGIIK